MSQFQREKNNTCSNAFALGSGNSQLYCSFLAMNVHKSIIGSLEYEIPLNEIEKNQIEVLSSMNLHDEIDITELILCYQ